MKKKYKLISEDLQKNLIDFLDEVQLEAAKLKSTENMHIVNFCSYAIEELLSGFDAQFKNKKNPSKKFKGEMTQDEDFKPHIDDVAEYCSLEEIKEMLLDDPELSDHERFELYYDERERRKPKEKGLTYNQLLKGAGIKNVKKK